MIYKNIELKWLGHSGFLIKFSGINVFIDPFKLSDNINEKADLILITHSHYDHCSVEDIKKIIKQETVIIGPADILSQTRQIGDVNFKISGPEKNLDFKEIKIYCVPAYNTNKPYHSKDESWVGYIIDFLGTTVYHPGDSDVIPEMNNIRVNAAMFPVSGKFAMDYHEAAIAAEIIHPDLAIPMHWGTIIGTIDDAENFVKLCKGKGINAMVMEKEI
jgi:L-ascorbate metabolism protein UlaG (beta-lactamase superfamily)